MNRKIGFSKKEVSKALRGFRGYFLNNPRAVNKISQMGAEIIIAESRIRAPFRTGMLRDSEFIEKVKSNHYRFGFNESYARVMDEGFKTPIIKAKKGKALYIPLTRRGMRTGPVSGGLRKLSESRSSGGGVQGVDFIFRKSIKTPKLKPYGSQRGPNRYFTGTIKKMAGSSVKKVEFLRTIIRSIKGLGAI